MSNQLLYSAVFIEVDTFDKHTGNAKTLEGTGVFIRSGKNFLNLFSNRHVLEPAWAGGPSMRLSVERIRLSYFVASPDGMDSFPTHRATVSAPPSAVRVHPDHSVDVAGLAASDLVPSGAPEPISYFVPFDWVATKEQLNDSLQCGDVVLFPGYPEWRDRNGDRPILRYGAVVSDPRNDYRFGSGPCRPGDGAQQLVFEALSVSGNSGSPVYSAEKGFIAGMGLTGGNHSPVRLVGINAGHYSTGASTHSGLSRAHKSTTLIELLSILDEEASRL